MRIVEHVYWNGKVRFDLAEDRYGLWTMFVVEEGTFRFTVERPEIPANEAPLPVLPLDGEAGFGSAVLCPPGGRLRREAITPLTFHYVQFEWEAAIDGPCGLEPGLIAFEDVRRLRSTCAHLREASERNPKAEGRWVAHLTLDLLLLYEAERRRAVRPERRFSEDALMSRAAAAIEARAGAPLLLEALAAELGLSPVRLTRRFRAAFGETPSHYLKAVRLREARRLLDDTELTLAQIAERCGYENGFYLSRVFTQDTGMPPSEYRRRRRI
ncbi:AraC family transcriptional regulator [Saccharibacillus qingshengii]|uniref:AraC family transcriptional regulator n=1 Tax=Saccharibacillus qingshengii TaxID=1763540 RepID=UPI001554FC49|nr:helix-turn-helix transcriptional regulator [Saccharibacillus qingshengii]